MSTLFTHHRAIAVWTGTVLGLFGLFGPELVPATGSLLVLIALAPPAIMVTLWRAPSVTVAQSIATVLHPVEVANRTRRR